MLATLVGGHAPGLPGSGRLLKVPHQPQNTAAKGVQHEARTREGPPPGGTPPISEGFLSHLH